MLTGVISVNGTLAYRRLPVRFKPAQVTGKLVPATEGVALLVLTGLVGELDTTGCATLMEQLMRERISRQLINKGVFIFISRYQIDRTESFCTYFSADDDR